MTWKLSISGYWQHQSNQPWCWNGWLNCTEKKNLSGLEKNSFVWFEKTNSKPQHISIFSLKFCAKIKDLCFSWYKKQCQEMGHFWRLSAWTMGVCEISHAKIFCTHTFDLFFFYLQICQNHTGVGQAILQKDHLQYPVWLTEDWKKLPVIIIYPVWYTKDH